MAHTQVGIAVEDFVKGELKLRGVDGNASVRESRENLGFSQQP